jgi:hypothetical protein
MKTSYYIKLSFVVCLFMLAAPSARGSEADVFTKNFTKETASLKDTLHEGEFIRDSSRSNDGSVAVYLISKNEGGGSNYVCLIVVHFNKNGEIESKARKLSLESMRQKNSLWLDIIELKAIDTNNSTVQARVGIKSAEQAPYKVTYNWESQPL